MPFISVTRLRIRSLRFVPFFLLYTNRSLRQVKRAPGFVTGSLLADRKWTYWTMTLWDSHESMRAYMTAGAHRAAMPHLMSWCDEASVVHWNAPEATLPSWTEADKRMRENGRASKVRSPSPEHAGMNYRSPRLTAGVAIRASNA